MFPIFNLTQKIFHLHSANVVVYRKRSVRYKCLLYESEASATEFSTSKSNRLSTAIIFNLVGAKYHKFISGIREASWIGI